MEADSDRKTAALSEHSERKRDKTLEPPPGSKSKAILVEGSSARISGEYAQVGTSHGKPRYAKLAADGALLEGDEEVVIRWAGEGTVGFGDAYFAWIINVRDQVPLHAVGDGVAYYHVEDAATPPANGWTAIHGDPQCICLRSLRSTAAADSADALEAFLSKWNLATSYHPEHEILNLQGKGMPAPAARELASALSRGHVKWVLARFGIDEIDVETATALTVALQADTCSVNYIDLRNCPCTSQEAHSVLVTGLTAFSVNEVELEATRIGSEDPPEAMRQLED